MIKFLLACGHNMPYLVKFYDHLLNKTYLTLIEQSLIEREIYYIHENFNSIKSLYSSPTDHVCTNCEFHENKAREKLVELYYMYQEKKYIPQN